ncbi:MAG TPA: YidB family protein [Spirochaetota bacterium]|nr:YidB family protein [Spirochaetota bacterium]HPJ40590.1 YidB family protein [Spirochaetota bacterium]
MGILDKIVSAAQTIGKERGHNQNVVENVVGLFKENGVNGLVEKFRERGLEETVKSWIGTGENQPISQEQVRDTLGADKVRDFAEKSGMSEDQATRELQDILPDVMDKATPDGVYNPEDDGKE